MRGFIHSFAKDAWIFFCRGWLIVSGHPRLARALQRKDCGTCDEIERLRTSMLLDDSPLIDGSLGEGGRYDQDQTVADACRVSKPRNSARLLYSVTHEYRPTTLIELGTNVGISSAYLAAAGGRVTTLESSPYRLRLAQKLHDQIGLKIDYVQGLFDETLASALAKLPPVSWLSSTAIIITNPRCDISKPSLRRRRRTAFFYLMIFVGPGE